MKISEATVGMHVRYEDRRNGKIVEVLKNLSVIRVLFDGAWGVVSVGHLDRLEAYDDNPYDLEPIS